MNGAKGSVIWEFAVPVEPPKQRLSVVVTERTIGFGWLTCIVVEAEHKFVPSVTVTPIGPAPSPVIDWPVWPFVHKYE